VETLILHVAAFEIYTHSIGK